MTLCMMNGGNCSLQIALTEAFPAGRVSSAKLKLKEAAIKPWAFGIGTEVGGIAGEMAGEKISDEFNFPKLKKMQEQLEREMEKGKKSMEKALNEGEEFQQTDHSFDKNKGIENSEINEEKSTFTPNPTPNSTPQPTGNHESKHKAEPDNIYGPPPPPGNNEQKPTSGQGVCGLPKINFKEDILGNLDFEQCAPTGEQLIENSYWQISSKIDKLEGLSDSQKDLIKDEIKRDLENLYAGDDKTRAKILDKYRPQEASKKPQKGFLEKAWQNTLGAKEAEAVIPLAAPAVAVSGATAAEIAALGLATIVAFNQALDATKNYFSSTKSGPSTETETLFKNKADDGKMDLPTVSEKSNYGVPGSPKGPDEDYLKKVLGIKIAKELIKKYEGEDFPKKFDKYKKIDGSGRYECEGPESPIWKELKNFKGEYKSNGLKGKKERFFRWDRTHKDIEVYNKDAVNVGSIDPITGKQYRAGTMKPNDKLRSIIK